MVHSMSLAAPRFRRHRHGPPGRDGPRPGLAAPPRGHDPARAALARGRAARAPRRGAALLVPSRRVAADLVALGIEEGRMTVVPGGADHLPDPDPEAAGALLGGSG